MRFPEGSSFQYEPGGQVEIATSPCSSLDKLIHQLRFQQGILDQLTSAHQIHFLQMGTHPWFDAAQIGLQLEKPRYLALQKYFSQLGPSGVQMMRQTCSLHVNLDLGETEDLQAKRYVAANLLTPFATALFANSGILERKVTLRKSHRSYLWQQLDPKRSGIRLGNKPGELFSKSSLIDAYLDFAMKAPIIHIKSVEKQVFSEEFTFGGWIQNPIDGINPSIFDLENHLSLLYPEVRPKGFLEIRTADALPGEWQLVPAFFYTGLLYSDTILDKVLEVLLPYRNEMDTLWRKGSFGFESNQILTISQQLMSLAIDGLNGLPDDFVGKESQANLITFFEKFPSQGKTLADECIYRFSEGKSLIFLRDCSNF
ncbi:glutamate-cysteine ligase family protein [Algoriphagus boritolerans]|uniref:glutamate-cysteine ligase family protein n=1 Tax=Algoriphagus boritolerans TaxID=308111 RepID=UPI002FCDEB86